MPDVSLIIPTFNRPARVAALLGALAKLQTPRDAFEVILVDDGSDAPLDAVVAPFREHLDLVLIRQSNAGPARARNVGVAQSRGSLLVFTDDDVEPAPDWLDLLSTKLRMTPNAMVGGWTENGLPENLCSEASQLLVDYLYRVFRRGENLLLLTTNNLAVRREDMERIAGFDENYPLAAAEDRDLCDRWLEKGGRILLVPEARIFHFHRLTLRRFLRQHFNYGRGAWMFRLARVRRQQAPISIEPSGFYKNLLLFPLQKHRGFKAYALVTLMFLTQAANAIGFFWQKFFGTFSPKVVPRA